MYLCGNKKKYNFFLQSLRCNEKSSYICNPKRNAEVAQLVEHNLAKVGVAGPSPVFRSKDLRLKGVLSLK